jgi:hypothetical protein
LLPSTPRLASSARPGLELESAFRASWRMDELAPFTVWRHPDGIDYEPIADRRSHHPAGGRHAMLT